jgi:anti-sigma factor RsiW
MSHRDAWELLDEFLDGALAAEARWAVAAHLDECSVCRRQLAHQARQRGIVREWLSAVEPPPGLAARLAAAISSEPVASQPAPQPRWSLPALRLLPAFGTAAIAVVLLALLILPVRQAGANLTSDLAANHALFARDESLLDVVGDATVISTWFQYQAGVHVSTPEIGSYHLVGGRLIALEGEPVAQLVYEGPEDEMYLSLLQFTRGADRDWFLFRDSIDSAQEGAMSLVTWTMGDDRLALIGNMPESELRRLVDDLASRMPGEAPVSG